MTRSEIRRKAISVMDQRKLNAELELNRRREEVIRKIPQIEEIQRMMAQTASELSKDIIRRASGFKANFERIRSANQESAQMIKQLLVQNGYPEDYLEVHYRCKECGDTGYLNDGMCSCMHRLIKQISCEDLNKSANMPDADFNHFSLDYYRGLVIDGIDCYSKMSQNLDFCLRYAQNFSRSSKSVLMLGGTGVGKTHLSMSIAREVTQNGFDVVYGSVVNLLRSVEKEHFGKSEAADDDSLEILCSCDLLIIDDLGSEHHTPFYEATLYNIINTRINSSLPTIISANLSLEALYGRYNERIISRIAGYYEVLLFKGKDIRQLRRLQQG